MNAIDKIKELAGKIPAYAGYRDLESRRASDRALREATADAFQSQITRLNRVQEQAIRQGNFDSVESLDSAIGRMRHLVDRLNTASEGYGGLFDDAPVREEALDRLYDFDLAFAKGVERVADLIAGMGGPTPTQEVVPTLLDTLDELHATFDGRKALIERPHEMRPAAPDADPLDEVSSVSERTQAAWSPAAPAGAPEQAYPAGPYGIGTNDATSQGSAPEQPVYPPSSGTTGGAAEGESQPLVAPMSGDAPAATEPPPYSPSSLDALNDPPPLTDETAASGAFGAPSDTIEMEVGAADDPSWSPASSSDAPMAADDSSNESGSDDSPHAETW